ncbi:preprotein translocase subunit SecE [candidate division WWE3 bacterium]|uniref:Protein translocase subunit SecE n=1 Tax=candidate division WWE3 bacterium TaxID=2053526 RepID=A0A955LW75_UNCKA|nr:preprotein translocase subunit SecE [candidate division WWE3 bacterium]
MLQTVQTFFKDAFQELKKVKAPSKERAFRLTAVVLVVCLIIGGYIGILDYALTKLITVLI